MSKPQPTPTPAQRRLLRALLVGAEWSINGAWVNLYTSRECLDSIPKRTWDICKRKGWLGDYGRVTAAGRAVAEEGRRDG